MCYLFLHLYTTRWWGNLSRGEFKPAVFHFEMILCLILLMAKGWVNNYPNPCPKAK